LYHSTLGLRVIKKKISQQAPASSRVVVMDIMTLSVSMVLRGKFGGLVFQAHRLLYHSTLGLRVIKKKISQQAPASS